MDYRKILIHGETEEQIDEDGRYLEIKVKDGQIILYQEDFENGGPETPLDVVEALALIAALTEAIKTQL